MPDVGSTRDGARANGDDDLGRRHGVVRLLEREAHVLGDGAGDEQTVGVPRRGDVLNAETTEIEDDGPEHVDICLAAVAPASAHHT